jgi:hypothetical protein
MTTLTTITKQALNWQAPATVTTGAEVDFLFTDGTDYLFTDGTDYVFSEGGRQDTAWTLINKS